MAPKGQRSFIYNTSHELSFIRDLFVRNRVAFLGCAKFILEGRKSYAGDGMRVKSEKVKELINQLLEKHNQEYPSGYTPPERTREEDN